MEQPKIYRYETVDSTNTVCRTLAMEGAPDGTAVIARQQTAGRGRLGRRFESPPGMGLYLFLALLFPQKACPCIHANETSSVTQLITNSGKPLRFESPPNSLSCSAIDTNPQCLF